MNPRSPAPSPDRPLIALAIGCAALTACTAGEAAKFPLMPHEPSGAVAIAPGEVLIVEDEREHPFDLLRFAPELSVTDDGLLPPVSLNDLEGVTRDGEGRLYAVTSHSPDRKGKRKNSRERLARFRIAAGEIAGFRHLERLWPEPPSGFEIEGLAWDAERASLLFGLRGPADDGRAVLWRLTDPDAAFAGAEPQLSKLFVDLDGQGIRGIEHDAALGGFVIIGSDERDPVRYGLWLWDGESGRAERLAAPGFERLLQPEGLCPVEIGAASKLLIVSDDGTTDEAFYNEPLSKRAANRSTPGSYLLLDHEAIRRHAK